MKVAERSELSRHIEELKTAGKERDDEVQRLRSELEGLQKENDSLKVEKQGWVAEKERFTRNQTRNPPIKVEQSGECIAFFVYLYTLTVIFTPVVESASQAIRKQTVSISIFRAKSYGYLF